MGVAIYLRQGGDPDARNHHGWTLLQLAAAEGQSEVVKVLLDAKAKVNCCTTDMCTPLHRCATHGYKQVAQYLLEKGAYINAQDKAGNTPLHEAAKGLHTSIIKLLIDHKADVTKVNKKNQTFTDMVGQQIMSTVESGDTEVLAQWLDWNLNPNTVGTLHWSLLHHACARGQFDVANLLLERGANVNCVDSNRNTPLHVCSQHGHVQIAKLLIDKGANLNAQEQMGNTPLYSAVLGGHPDIICLLLERGIDHTLINKEGVLFTHLVNEFLVNAVMSGDAKTVWGLLKGLADPNSRDPYGMPVLCYAAFKGFPEVTEALLEYGADPNVSDTYLEKTPLHQAASGGHLFVAKVLLDKKALTNVKDKSGATPLHDAAKEGMEDTMSILMGRGAPLNATDADGNTPLHMAAKWGHTAAVEKLVESGADETIKNKSGNVYSDLALVRAVRTGEQSEVTSGLAWGGDPNCRDSRGWTLLHHAVYKDSLNITQILLECGAYVDAGDDHGRTPLLLASYKGNTDIVEVLLDAGANVDAQDWHGNTPLHWAAREGSIDTVQLLLKENPNTSIRNKEGFVYTNLLLKHLYFAVRHNDADKVTKLLAAGADQFARVDGTEVNPREEAKRRGFYEILRQMASLAKKKPRPEDDKIIAIEDVFRLFEDDNSTEDGEQSSDDDQDMASCEEDLPLEDSDEEEDYVQEEEDEEEFAYWKMSNAVCVLDAKEVFKSEEDSFWEHWDEKPKVIKARELFKEEEEAWWEEIENRPKVITVKQLLSEEQKPWWEDDDEEDEDDDDSSRSEAISAKEFFREDEEWWRDAVEDMDKNKGIPAKEFFKEDKPWWETEDDEEKQKIISAKEFFKDDDKPWWEDDGGDEDKMKGKVISAKEFFKEDDKPWWLEDDAEEREENRGFKKRVGGLKKNFKGAQWPEGENNRGSEDEWEEANDSIVHSGSTALLIPGGEKAGGEVPWWAKVNITRHIRRSLGQTSDSEGEGSSEESSEEGEEEDISSDEEGKVRPLRRRSGKEDKERMSEVTRVLSARDLFKETPWWEENRTEDRKKQNGASESESEDETDSDDIPVMPRVKLDYEMKASDLFKEEAWWDVSENSFSDEKDRIDDESELTEEFVSCDSRQKEDEDIERTEEISSANFRDAQSEIDDDTDLTYEDLSSKMDEDYSSTNLDFDEDDDSLHSELDDEILTVINESHDSETMMKELDELAVLNSDSDAENPLVFEPESPKTLLQETKSIVTPVNISETGKACENKENTITVTKDLQTQQSHLDKSEGQTHTNETVTIILPRRRQIATPSPRDELYTSLTHKNEPKDTMNFTNESETISPHVIPQDTHTQSIGRLNANRMFPDDSNTKEISEKDSKQEDETRITPQSKDQFSKTQSHAEDSSKVEDSVVSTSAVIITLESDSIVSTSMPGVVHSPVRIDEDMAHKSVSLCVKDSETNPKSSSNHLVFSSPFTSSDTTVLRESHPQEDASQPCQREQEAERSPKDDDSSFKDLETRKKAEKSITNNGAAVYGTTIQEKVQDTGAPTDSNSHPGKNEPIMNKMTEHMDKLNAALDRLNMGERGNGSRTAPKSKANQNNERTEAIVSNSEPSLVVSDDIQKNAMDDCLAKVDASLAWLDKRLSRDADYPSIPKDTSKRSSPAPSPATSEETLAPPNSHVVKGSVILENSRGAAGSSTAKTEGEVGKSSLRLIKVHVNIQERPVAQEAKTESETDIERKNSSEGTTSENTSAVEKKGSPEILRKHSTTSPVENPSIQKNLAPISASENKDNSQLSSENKFSDESVKRRYVSQVPYCPELETTEKRVPEEVSDMKTLNTSPGTHKLESTEKTEAPNESPRRSKEQESEPDQPVTYPSDTIPESTKLHEEESVHETVKSVQESERNWSKESPNAAETDEIACEARKNEGTRITSDDLKGETSTAKPDAGETEVQEEKKPSCSYEMALSRSPSPVRRVPKRDSMSPLNLSRENSIEKLFPLPRVAPQRTLWRCSTYDAMSLNDYDDIAAIINKSASFPANWKSVGDWKENFGSIESLDNGKRSSSCDKEQGNFVEMKEDHSSEESDHSFEEESFVAHNVGIEKHEKGKIEEDREMGEKSDAEDKGEVRVKLEEVQKCKKGEERRKAAMTIENKMEEAETGEQRTKVKKSETVEERKIEEGTRTREKREEEEKVKAEGKRFIDKENGNKGKRETEYKGTSEKEREVEDKGTSEKERETELVKEVNIMRSEEEDRETGEKTDIRKRNTIGNREDKRDSEEREKSDKNGYKEMIKTRDGNKTTETRNKETIDYSKPENVIPMNATEGKETIDDNNQNEAPKLNENVVEGVQENNMTKTEAQEHSEEGEKIEGTVLELEQETLGAQSKIPVAKIAKLKDASEKPEAKDKGISEIPGVKSEIPIAENEDQTAKEKVPLSRNETPVAKCEDRVSEKKSQMGREEIQSIRSDDNVGQNAKHGTLAVKNDNLMTKDEIPLSKYEAKLETPLPKNDTPKVNKDTQMKENKSLENKDDISEKQILRGKYETLVAKHDPITVDQDIQITVNETTVKQNVKSGKDISTAKSEIQPGSKDSEKDIESTSIPVKPPRGQKSEKTAMSSKQIQKAESQSIPMTDQKYPEDKLQREQDSETQTRMPENKSHVYQEHVQTPGDSIKPQNQTQMSEKISPEPPKRTHLQAIKLSQPPKQTQAVEKKQVEPLISKSPQPQEQTQQQSRSSSEPQNQIEVAVTKALEPQKQAQAPTRKSPEPQKQTQTPTMETLKPQKQSQAQTTKTLEPQKRTQAPTRKSPVPQKQAQAPTTGSPEPQKQTQAPTAKSLEPQRKTQTSIRKSPEPQKQSLIPIRKSPDPQTETTVRKSPDPQNQAQTTVSKSPEPKKQPQAAKRKPLKTKKQTQAAVRKSPEPENQPQTASKRSYDQISSRKSPPDPQNQTQTSKIKVPNPQSQTQSSTTKLQEPHKQTQKQSKISTEPPNQSQKQNRKSPEPQKQTQTRVSPEPQNQMQTRASPEPQKQTQSQSRTSSELQKQTQAPTKKLPQQQKQAKSPVRIPSQHQKQVQGESKKPPQSPKQAQQHVKKTPKSHKRSQVSDKKSPDPASQRQAHPSQVQVPEDKAHTSQTQSPEPELLDTQSQEQASNNKLGGAKAQAQEENPKIKSRTARVESQTSQSNSSDTPVQAQIQDNKQTKHSPVALRPQPLDRTERTKRIPQQPDERKSHDPIGERKENGYEQNSHIPPLESLQAQNRTKDEEGRPEIPNKGQDVSSNTQVSNETENQCYVNTTHKDTGTRQKRTSTSNVKVQTAYDEADPKQDKGFPSTDPQLSGTSERSLENTLNKELTDPPEKPSEKGSPGGEEVTLVAAKFRDDLGGSQDSSFLSPTHEPVTTLAPPLVPQGTGDEKVMAAAECKAELTATSATEVLVQPSNTDLLYNADRPEAAKVEGNTLSGLASPSRTPVESVKRSESQSENTQEARSAGQSRSLHRAL